LGRGGDEGFYRPVDPAVRLRIVPFPDGPPGEMVGARILRSIATLRTAFDPVPYDIIHAQDCISANAVGRCVRTVHHIDHFTTPELAACHERAIVEPYAHICVSRSVAEELKEGWDLTAEVIPNGVAYDRFAATDPASQASWRSRLGRYVLTVGGIEPRKGSLDLLEAYALLRAQHPDVRLVIAGGETLFDYRDYRTRWEQRAAELGVDPVVLGPVPDDELPPLVAAASPSPSPPSKRASASPRWRPSRRAYRWSCGTFPCCGRCSDPPRASRTRRTPWPPGSATPWPRRIRSYGPQDVTSPPGTLATRPPAGTWPSTAPCRVRPPEPLREVVIVRAGHPVGEGLAAGRERDPSAGVS
jgi:hypothetical protein